MTFFSVFVTFGWFVTYVLSVLALSSNVDVSRLGSRKLEPSTMSTWLESCGLVALNRSVSPAPPPGLAADDVGHLSELDDDVCDS